MLLQKYGQLLRHDALYRASCLTVAQLLLRLALKLRLLNLDAHDCRQTFPDIVSCQVLI